MAQSGIAYKLASIFFWTLAAGSAILLIVDVWQVVVTHFSSPSLNNLAGDVMWPILPFILAGCLGNYVLPDLHRRDQLRLMVRSRSGEGVPLAVPQPVLDAMALPLPTTIRLRPRWPVVLLWNVLLILLIGLMAAGHILLKGEYPPLSVGLVLFLILGLGLIFFAAMFAGSMVGSRQAITVTDEGLSYRQFDMTQTIRWGEADLFAVVDGRQRDPSVVIYELSSPRALVRWRRWRRATPFASTEPTLAFGVYDQQMQALLNLIAARTGLPLYDLR